MNIECESFSAKWETFYVEPSENGRYAVCHRGRIFGNAYFMDGTWTQWPKFGPTHWLNGGYDKLSRVSIGGPRMDKQLGYAPKTFY